MSHIKNRLCLPKTKKGIEAKTKQQAEAVLSINKLLKICNVPKKRCKDSVVRKEIGTYIPCRDSAQKPARACKTLVRVAPLIDAGLFIVG